MNTFVKLLSDSMRLWSIHPKYLDAKGLVALWREGLLAMHVLEGRTKGYTNHPQLIRFKQTEDPVKAINAYLKAVYEEALSRNYAFDGTKIRLENYAHRIGVSKAQLNYERNHLMQKLKTRDPQKFQELVHLHEFIPHPLFCPTNGEIEPWEKLT